MAAAAASPGRTAAALPSGLPDVTHVKVSPSGDVLMEAGRHAATVANLSAVADQPSPDASRGTFARAFHSAQSRRVVKNGVAAFVAGFDHVAVVCQDGHVLVLRTDVPPHPLRGVSAVASLKLPSDILGATETLTEGFTITDIAAATSPRPTEGMALWIWLLATPRGGNRIPCRGDGRDGDAATRFVVHLFRADVSAEGAVSHLARVQRIDVVNDATPIVDDPCPSSSSSRKAVEAKTWWGNGLVASEDAAALRCDDHTVLLLLRCAAPTRRDPPRRAGGGDEQDNDGDVDAPVPPPRQPSSEGVERITTTIDVTTSRWPVPPRPDRVRVYALPQPRQQDEEEETTSAAGVSRDGVAVEALLFRHDKPVGEPSMAADHLAIASSEPKVVHVYTLSKLRAELSARGGVGAAEEGVLPVSMQCRRYNDVSGALKAVPFLGKKVAPCRHAVRLVPSGDSTVRSVLASVEVPVDNTHLLQIFLVDKTCTGSLYSNQAAALYLKSSSDGKPDAVLDVNWAANPADVIHHTAGEDEQRALTSGRVMLLYVAMRRCVVAVLVNLDEPRTLREYFRWNLE